MCLKLTLVLNDNEIKLAGSQSIVTEHNSSLQFTIIQSRRPTTSIHPKQTANKVLKAPHCATVSIGLFRLRTELG